MRKAAVITIDPDKSEIDIQTGDYNKVEILDALKAVNQLLANQVIEEAKKTFGPGDGALEMWLKRNRNNPKDN